MKLPKKKAPVKAATKAPAKAKAKPKASKVKNVIPASYNGVAYKSSLEAYCAKALTEAGLAVNYEKVKFPIMDAFTCPSSSIEFKLKKNKDVPMRQNLFEETSPRIRGMIYTPDFTSLETAFKWVCEVKGFRESAYNQRFKLFRHYLYRQQLNYQLYVPNNRDQINSMITHILTNNLTHGI